MATNLMNYSRSLCHNYIIVNSVFANDHLIAFCVLESEVKKLISRDLNDSKRTNALRKFVLSIGMSRRGTDSS